VAGPIETCCTIAWMALSVEMLKLTSNPIVADELELSTLNSVLGLYSPTGRWTTYNTPMDGERRAFVQDIHWQCRAGSPELNCCGVNAPRGLGMLSDWALMQNEEGLVLNYYGASEMRTRLNADMVVTLRQETEYPRQGRIPIEVTPSRATRFPLLLRIPLWSRHTRVRVNGKFVAVDAPGTYLVLERKWSRGDRVEIELDFSPRVWVGERECEGKTSIYRGPILLTYDSRYNDNPPELAPRLDGALKGRRVFFKRPVPPMLLMQYSSVEGRPVRLCDFASAGATGTPYRSWLNVV
ncbi:MAG TPA: beta-L-arabinofuranosidase domain-containing protein, partial [Anaerolineae bacterium]|nr:beta-L-arabinofuranosidase domain-containing protein [Anaerolineae bacterium]